MAALRERPRIELRGLRRRGGVQAAVLVLEGAAVADLDRACDLAGMLADRCLLVAVDGGVRACRARRRRPDLWIGDGDSAAAIPSDIPSIPYDTDKDFSDLAGALVEMRRRKVQVVALAGLLGGRLDHEWSNLFEVAARARDFAALVAPGDRGMLVVTRHGCRAATVRRRTVSLFSLSASCNVSLRGTRWELDHTRLRPDSLGLSNITGTELDLVVHAGTAGLLFLPAGPRPREKR